MFTIFPKTSAMMPMRQSYLSLLNRPLFCDTFHGVDKIAGKVAKQKLLISNPVVFKEKIRNNFEKSGLRNIFSEEVEKFQLLCEDKEDLDFALALIDKSLSSDFSSVRMDDYSFENILLYFQICYLKNLPNQALKGWKNPTLKSTTLLENNKTISRLHFDLLFNNAMYQEIVDEFFSNINHNVKHSGPTTLTSLACYKLGTRKSLEQSIRILSLSNSHDVTVGKRCTKSAALLAYNLEEYAVAHDIIKKYGGKGVLFNDTLELMVLAAAGRLEEAILFFRVNFVPRLSDEEGRKVLYCGVEKLIVAVKENGDKEMLKEVMEMVFVMDKTVTVRNETLEDILFDTITSDRSKENSNHRNERRKRSKRKL